MAVNGLTIKNNIENELDARADRDLRNKKIKKQGKEVLFFVRNQFSRRDAIKVLNYALKCLEHK